MKNSIPATSIKTAVFTIVSLNYGAFAKTLMESVAAVHPEWDRFVLLVDQCGNPAALAPELFVTVTADTLPLPKKREFLFRYGIMELNTAVKPYMFSHLRKQGYQHLVYIDPDVLVVDPLEDVERLLNEGATGVLTPHLTAPLDDGLSPGELDIMRAGSFNLGFLALGNVPAADAFISWWEQKLEYGAISDPDKGLFTDQKWVDLAPGMFGGFAILRDPGYNVAYWNLPHRPVTHDNGNWMAAGCRLRFFHFSGFDPLNPAPFSKHQNRLTLDSIGAARELALNYAGRVKHHGLSECRDIAYSYGIFSNGVSIPPAIRKLYREDADVRRSAGEDPFNNGDYFIHGEAGNLPVILRAVWLARDDLQRAFPDPLGISRTAYYQWFSETGGVEIGIPEAFIAPIRAAYRKAQEEAAARTAFGSPHGASGKNADAPSASGKPSLWARVLVFLHKRATGGRLSPQRLVEYRRVAGARDFFRLGYTQFRSSRLSKKLGLTVIPKPEPDPMEMPIRGTGRQIPAGLPAGSLGVNVVGYARSEHGVGQSLRQFVASLDACQIPNVIIDFNNNNLSRVEDLSLEKRIVNEPAHGINVFHINADQMPEVEMHLPPHYLARYNIGFWHWELPELPTEFLSGFNNLHEVWVPTGFVQDAVAKCSPIPVVRMPHAISFTVSKDATRAQFGLPEGKFLFLMMYDFSSYQERKNPQAALDAFDMAFAGKNEHVMLVIKTQNAKHHEDDVKALQQRLTGRRDVIWINQTITRQQVYDLQSVCDALVSLHRSEGYGLGPAEAMFLGKPVIATNWSGNTEFMNQQNSLPVNYTLAKIERSLGVYKAGQSWAHADVPHAANLMRQIVSDSQLYKRISREARRTMNEQYTPEVIGQRILARLRHIQQRMTAV